MIDGIKILIIDRLVVGRMAANPLFNFIIDIDEATGGIVRKSAKYKGLEVIIYPSGKAIVKGSLHKFYNEGKHNHNEFNRNMLRQSIINLELIFGCEILETKIEHIEFGVNVRPPISTRKLMQKIIMYSRESFKDGTFADSDFKEVDLQQFYIKAYDKGRQYKQHEPIFRFEYKAKKMQPLNDIGLYCLGDLLKDETYAKLGRILNGKWNRMLIIDDSIRADELTPKQANDLRDWLNPMYWYKLTSSANPKKFNQELDRYKKVVVNHSDNVHEQTRLLIMKKWEKLTTIPKPKKLVLGNITHLYKGLILPYSDIRCKVTNLPIEMQKDGSVFLGESGAKFYYENHSGIYKYYLKPCIRDEWQNSPLTVQFEKIAHSIRNKQFNKIHNTRRSINKLIGAPSLFDNMQMIDKEKLMIAGYSKYNEVGRGG